jgi:hypothetical protein
MGCMGTPFARDTVYMPQLDQAALLTLQLLLECLLQLQLRHAAWQVAHVQPVLHLALVHTHLPASTAAA